MAKKITKKAAKKAVKKIIRNAVKVGGKEYSSAWQAFIELKLGTAAQCARFRKLLKKDGKASFEKGKKKTLFIIVK